MLLMTLSASSLYNALRSPLQHGVIVTAHYRRFNALYMFSLLNANLYLSYYIEI